MLSSAQMTHLRQVYSSSLLGLMPQGEQALFGAVGNNSFSHPVL